MKLNDTELIRLANDFISESVKSHQIPTMSHSPSTTASRALHRYLYSDGMEIGPYENILPDNMQMDMSDAEIRQLTLLQTCAYLQCLARHDRVSDCYVSAVHNGKLATILKHYLALVASEG